MDEETIRILLVEDNPGDARLIRELLREAGAGASGVEMDHVERLEDAAIRMAERPADVVLLDLSLPDAHGMETVTRMLEAAPEAPIIVLTGLDDEATAVRAVQAGAQDYLVKGDVDGALLLRAMRYARERKLLERERARLLQGEKEARATAEAAVRGRDEVLRVVSHDLGNSLSAVQVTTKVLLQRLSGSDPSDPVRQGLQNIRSLAEQMQHLRQDLLDVAMLEAGRLSMDQRPVRADELVEVTAERYRALAAEKEVGIELRVSQGLGEVMGDPERLAQVLVNLVTNAIKFTPSGGTITLGAEPAADGVRFYVADTGQGISPEHLPHLFDRFWTTRAGNPHGAGLGLAIATGIVAAHGGSLTAESEPGRGSTFSFVVPVA